MKIKVAYIVSQIDKALAFEWIIEKIDSCRFELFFVLLNSKDSELERFVIQHNITYKRIYYAGKKNLLSAFFQTSYFLVSKKIKIVHCHLFEADLIGLSSAWLFRIPKRIYTRHHSTLHHQYHPKAVFWDRVINFLATDIIAISQVAQKVLIEKENVKASKVHLIHHGFDLDMFQEKNHKKIEEVRIKNNIPHSYPIIGVIARYTYWKGIQYIIPAFEKLKKDYPDAHLVLANAKGDYETTIKQILKTLPANSYTEITFEKDIASLYQVFDVYVHTPIDGNIEAFGQSYVEALVSGIPSVFSLSGIAHEFVLDGKNALVVDYQNSEAIYRGCKKILEDSVLKEHLILNGFQSVAPIFALAKMIKQLENLYIT